MPPGTLGLNSPSTKTLWLSPDAAGQGWFIDPTPQTDDEFAGDIAQIPAAATHIDLLTVAAHELGHILGFANLADNNTLGTTMSNSLPDGLRRVPTALSTRTASADNVFTALGLGDFGGPAVTQLIRSRPANAPSTHIADYFTNLGQED